MKGSGGTEGGVGLFFIGLCLAIGSLWLFFDSVHVGTGHYGWIFRNLHQHGWTTTSMGVIFLPFFLGVLALFYDASKKWPWFLVSFGLVTIVIEILSRIRFHMSMKTTHLLIIIVMFAAGTAFMLRSYKRL